MLMDNLEQVNKLQKEVNKAAGNSKRKYNEDYAESVEAKVKNLKHAWEELYQSLISSDALKIILQTGTKLVGVLDALIHSSRGTKVSLLVLLPTIILIGKHFKYMIDIIKSGKDLKFIDVLWGSLFGKMTSGVGVVESLKGAFKSLFGTISSFNALITSPTGLMFAGIAVTIGVATAAIVKHIKHQKDLREENKKLKKSYEDLTKAMRENNKEEIKNAIEDPQKAQDELQALMKRRDELKKAMKNTPHMTGMSGENNADLKETEIRIQELQKSIKSSNLTLNETTGKIIDIAKAKNQIVNSDVADAIKETAEYELKEKDYIAGLYDEYNRLSSIKNKSKTEEKELSNVSEKLNDNVKGLILTKDKEGNVIIENTGLLNDEVKMLKTEGMTVEELTKAKLEAAKEHAQIQRGMTKISYEEARKRILFLHEEMRKREPLADAIDKVLPSAKITGMNPVRRQIDMLKDESVELEEQMARLDSIFKQPSSMNISETPDFNPVDPEKEKKSTDALKENTGEIDKNREAVNKAKEAVKQYELALKSLELQMTKNDISLGRLYKNSDAYRKKLDEKANLIKQEIALNKQQIATNKELAGSLGAVSSAYTSGMSSSIGEQVVKNAQQYLGRPYKWGGSTPSENFDCSGLVQYVYKQVGVSLNRTTYDQVKQGTPVSKNQLQVGDAVFFGSPSAPHHVGIYMGNGQYIHAPKTGDVIKVSSLNSRSDYATARRYVSGSGGYNRVSASNYTGEYSNYINEAAAKYGVSAALIAAVIKAESNFNPNDVSGSGAIGLMQLMPATARELGVGNPYDPKQNIMGGTRELANLIKKYNGNLDLVLAGYNAGVGAVEKFGGVPPYKETKDYIPKVKKYMKGFGGSESSIHSVIDEQMDLIGKSMDMEKKNAELMENLNKINIEKLESRLGEFDDKVKSIDRTITQLRTDVDLQNKNDINYINYLSKIDDYTVKKLDTLRKEREFIEKEMKSGIYDETTIHMLSEKYSDIGTEMLNVTKTIKDVSLELVTAKWEAIQQIYKENIEMISNELDRLSLHEEKNIKQIMILKKQLVEQDEENIRRMTELIRETNDIAYKYGKDFLLDKVREYTAELDKANTELEKHKKELEDIKDKMSEMKSTIEDKLREVLTKTAELAKEQLDKVLKHFEESIDAELKKIDDAEKRNSYNEQKSEQLKTIAELQEKIAKLSTDDSEEGIARRLEYEKQLQEEMKKKTDLQMKHNNELKKEALTKQKEEKKKEIEKKKRDIDTRLDNVYLNLDARKALTEGYIEWIDGKRIGIQNALLQFEDLFGKGLTSLGDKIKKELLEQLKAAQDLVNGIEKQDPDKILEENKTKNVYGTGADLANARKILGSLGYNYIDTSLVDKNKLHFGKDDIVVGDTGAINGVDRQDLNGAIRLGGKNRYDTAGIIQLYSDIQSGRIKPVGGIVYGTGQDLKNAIAWLSPLGYEFVDTSKINSKDINFNPNDIIVGGKGAKGGVNFD